MTGVAGPALAEQGPHVDHPAHGIAGFVKRTPDLGSCETFLESADLTNRTRRYELGSGGGPFL